MAKICFALLVVIYVTSQSVTGRHVTSPKWIYWEDVIRSELIPGGVIWEQPPLEDEQSSSEEESFWHMHGSLERESGPKSTYIGRIPLDGGEMIWNVQESQDNITFEYNGQEHTTSEFELLVYPYGALIWRQVVTTNNASCLPADIFVGGVEVGTGTPMYICRAWHDSNLVVGKLTEKMRMCEVIDGEYKSHKYNMFDVLVKNNPETCPERSTRHKGLRLSQWVPSGEVNTTELLQVGVENGDPYYIGRTTMFGGTVPGKAKVRNGTSEFWYTLNNKEYSRKSKFDYLVYAPGALTWVEVVTVKNRTCLPGNAFPGGIDPRTDGIFFICRAWHESHFVVGKMSEESGKCEVGMGHDEYKYKEFDVLVENDRSCSVSLEHAQEYLQTSDSIVGISICLIVIVGLVAAVSLLYFFGGFKHICNWCSNVTGTVRRHAKARRYSNGESHFNNVLSS